MNTPFDEEGQARAQALSALSDGELDEAGLAALSSAWALDAESRARWHSYQLIGDVLRSGDLASRPGHDAAFLARLREQLAAEPVVLAPPPAVSSDAVPPSGRSMAERRRRRTWMASSAIAAGVAMVVVAALAVRLPIDDGAAQLAKAEPPVATPVAAAPAAVTTVSLAPARDTAEGAAPVHADAKLIRDARLDRYLAAHKQFSGSSVLGLPSGFLRDAASDAPSR